MPSRLSWLAPGFVADKAAEPDPQPAQGDAPQLRAGAGFRRARSPRRSRSPSADDIRGELARFLSRATGVPVAALDFDEAALEPHLRMNLRLRDRRWQGAGRVARPRRHCGRASASAPGRRSPRAPAASWRRTGLREFPADADSAAGAGRSRRACVSRAGGRRRKRGAARVRRSRAKPTPRIRKACAGCWTSRWPTRSSRRASSCRCRPRPACCTRRSNRRSACAATSSRRRSTRCSPKDWTTSATARAFERAPRRGVGGKLFGEAMERLKLAETILVGGGRAEAATGIAADGLGARQPGRPAPRSSRRWSMRASCARRRPTRWRSCRVT